MFGGNFLIKNKRYLLMLFSIIFLCSLLFPFSAVEAEWVGAPPSNTGTGNSNPIVEGVKTVGGWIGGSVQAGTGFVLGGLFKEFMQDMIFFLLSGVSLAIVAAGGLLNFAILISIESSYLFINDSSIIKEIWIIIRNFVNIALIFGLLYTAIQIILRSSSGKKMLSGIIVVAILINFSAMFTKLAIDISNRITLEFYYAIVGDQEDPNRLNTNFKFNGEEANSIMSAFKWLGEEKTKNQKIDRGMSGVILQQIAITSVFDPRDSNSAEAAAQIPAVLIALIFGIIIIIVASLVIAAMAILLLIRLVVLMLLIATSPLGFLSFAFPNSSMAKKWLSTLYDNLIFAPVMFMVLWIGIKFLGLPPQQRNLVNSVTEATATQQDTFNAVFSIVALFGQFIAVIIILIMSITVAKKTGALGAAKMEGWVKGATGAFTGALGRNTLGRGARAIGTSFDTWYSRQSQGAKEDKEKGRTSLRSIVFNNKALSTIARTGKDFVSDDIIEKVGEAKFGSKYNIYEKEAQIRKSVAKEDRVENAMRGLTLLEEARSNYSLYQKELDIINNSNLNEGQKIIERRKLSKALHTTKDSEEVNYSSLDGRTVNFQEKDKDGRVVSRGKYRQFIEHLDNKMDYHDFKELTARQNKKDLLNDDLFILGTSPEIRSALLKDEDFSTAERDEFKINHRKAINSAISRGEFERLKIMNPLDQLLLSRDNVMSMFEADAHNAENGYFEETLSNSTLLRSAHNSGRYSVGRKQEILKHLHNWGAALAKEDANNLQKITKDFKNMGRGYNPASDISPYEFMTMLTWIASERNAKDMQQLTDAAGKLIDFSEQKSFNLKPVVGGGGSSSGGGASNTSQNWPPGPPQIMNP